MSSSSTKKKSHPMDLSELFSKTPTSTEKDWDDMSGVSGFASLQSTFKAMSRETDDLLNSMLNSSERSSSTVQQRSATAPSVHFYNGGSSVDCEMEDSERSFTVDTPEMKPKASIPRSTAAAASNVSSSSVPLKKKSSLSKKKIISMDDDDDMSDEEMKEEEEKLPLIAAEMRRLRLEVDLMAQRQTNAELGAVMEVEEPQPENNNLVEYDATGVQELKSLQELLIATGPPPPRAGRILMEYEQSLGRLAQGMDTSMFAAFVVVWTIAVIVLDHARHDLLAPDGMVQLPWILRRN
jgi:hypothetical protein